MKLEIHEKNLKEIIMNDSRGSLWRKWDLHVHSPASFGYIGTWEQFEDQLKKTDCDVIGINDYFSIEGYKRTKENIESGGLNLGNKRILPVVEFRMRDVLKNKHTSKSGVNINFHIIFSDEISVHKIETFIKGLKVDGSQIADKYTNSEFLCESAKVYFEQDIIKELNDNDDFKGNFLVYLPYDEYGGIDEIDPNTDDWIKRGFITKADILGSSNLNQIEFFLWKSPQKEDLTPKYTQEQFESWFIRKKPCIKGSDSHCHDYPIGKLKDKDSQPIEKYCWIKADPTFNGLKQIIIEPDERIFIGEKPPLIKRVEANQTKYIKELSFEKIEDSTLDESWFDDMPPIPVNNGLVAIIGNKGNGKSALSDIIGLAGNTRNFEGFSFLNDKKFRQKRPNRSENFIASVTWENGAKDECILSENPNPTLPEKVKYIPQSYLETLCTETDEKKFSTELKKVIFSHVDDSERLGKSSIDELIEYKSEEINRHIQSHKNELSEINSKLIDLEEKNTSKYKEQITNALKNKNEEYEAHQGNKPIEVQQPAKNEDLKKEHEEISNELSKVKAEKIEIENKIQATKEERKLLALKLARLQKFQQSIANYNDQYIQLREQYQKELIDYGFNFEDIINLTIESTALDKTIVDTTNSISEIDKKLDAEIENSLASQHRAKNEKIESLQGKLDEPSRKYQEYLDNLKTWQEKGNEIVGSDDKPETINFYKFILYYLNNQINVEIETLKAKRIEKVKSIYTKKSNIVELYRELYKPVTKFISVYGELMKDYLINLDVSIQPEDFNTRFFNYISRGAKGSFIGTDEGAMALSQISEGVDFNKEDEIISFLNDIIEKLQKDYRTKDKEERKISDQLKQDYETNEFYDFLFSLDYLTPNYKLKLGNKNLSELSPGERGALLLIFYLLLDKQEIPLVIDQPEENLDNQSVYGFLVKFIKEAKKKRQIIIVTHNPNLAVVCDAEQIISVKIEKENKNKVSCISGAIENPTINQEIVRILEGTFPAFDNRTEKYKVSKS